MIKNFPGVTDNWAVKSVLVLVLIVQLITAPLPYLLCKLGLSSYLTSPPHTLPQVSQHSVHQEEQANGGRPAVRLRGRGHDRTTHGDRRGTVPDHTGGKTTPDPILSLTHFDLVLI